MRGAETHSCACGAPTMGARLRQCMDSGLGRTDGRPWSYRTLGAQIHASPGTVHGWVFGANIPDRQLLKLSHLFGRPATWLRFGEGSPPINESLLASVIEAVHTCNDAQRLGLSPARIGRLSAAFYEMFREYGRVDRAAVERFCILTFS